MLEVQLQALSCLPLQDSSTEAVMRQFREKLAAAKLRRERQGTTAPLAAASRSADVDRGGGAAVCSASDLAVAIASGLAFAAGAARHAGVPGGEEVPGVFAPTPTLAWTLNPTGLAASSYAFALLCFLPGREAMGMLLRSVCRVFCGRQDLCVDQVSRLSAMRSTDALIILANAVVEFVGVSHAVAFVLYGPVEHRLYSFSLLRGPLAFMFGLTLNDVISYPVHRLCRRRCVPWVSHRQGLADTVNVNPCEHFYGFCIFLASLSLTAKVVGLHASTALVCLMSWYVIPVASLFNCELNLHVPLIYPMLSKEREVPRQFPDCNHGLLTSLCDRLGGSFRPSRDLEPEAPRPDKKWYQLTESFDQPEAPPAPERVALLPSPWATVAFAGVLFTAAVAIEIYHAGGLPSLADVSSLFRSALALIQFAVACAAAHMAAAVPPEKPLPPRQDGVPRAEKPRPARSQAGAVLEVAPKDGPKSQTLRQRISNKGVWKETLRPIQGESDKRG